MPCLPQLAKVCLCLCW